MASLLDMPRDPFQLVLALLDPLDLEALAQTCRRARELCALQWQWRGKALTRELSALIRAKAPKRKGRAGAATRRLQAMVEVHRDPRSMVLHHAAAHALVQSQWLPAERSELINVSETLLHSVHWSSSQSDSL